MKRFELAIDGECHVGKKSTVFVDTIQYGNKEFVLSDEREFEKKGFILLNQMSGKTIGEVVDIIRNNGLNFDKLLIDSNGVVFDSFGESFSHNVLLISFYFYFDNDSIVAYHD